jgi:hypothetical protein
MAEHRRRGFFALAMFVNGAGFGFALACLVVHRG